MVQSAHHSQSTSQLRPLAIPSLLMQTHQTCISRHPRGVLATLHPGLDYVFLDDMQAQRFLHERRPRALAAFNQLRAGAFRADLLRYAWLAEFGGFYADADLRLYFPLDAALRRFRAKLLLIQDVAGAGPAYYNGLMAGPAGHPVFEQALKLTIENVEQRAYGSHSLDISGPHLFGRAVNWAAHSGHLRADILLMRSLTTHSSDSCPIIVPCRAGSDVRKWCSPEERNDHPPLEPLARHCEPFAPKEGKSHQDYFRMWREARVYVSAKRKQAFAASSPWSMLDQNRAMADRSPTAAHAYSCLSATFHNATAICEQGRHIFTASARASQSTSFFSEWHQDWVVLASAFRGRMHSNLRYVDLGANEPIKFSNTYFMDRCLGWHGLCIEPDPQYHVALRKERSCELVLNRIADMPQSLRFAFAGGVGGLQHFQKPTSPYLGALAQARTQELRRSRLQAAIEAFGIDHIDYLSLDIEGAEAAAMRGVALNTTIDVITAKRATSELTSVLATHGLSPVMCISLDMMYVRDAALDSHGQPLAARVRRWFFQVGRLALPARLSLNVADCTEHPNTSVCTQLRGRSSKAVQ
mmetsp:Transcript_16873/g.28030  ORF Transcript_16873/g.28030 Transcript_16873/m.28030 type:complete len:583 (+) Transcript_16873:165-1913(+)